MMGGDEDHSSAAVWRLPWQNSSNSNKKKQKNMGRRPRDQLAGQTSPISFLQEQHHARLQGEDDEEEDGEKTPLTANLRSNGTNGTTGTPHYVPMNGVPPNPLQYQSLYRKTSSGSQNGTTSHHHNGSKNGHHDHSRTSSLDSNNSATSYTNGLSPSKKGRYLWDFYCSDRSKCWTTIAMSTLALVLCAYAVVWNVVAIMTRSSSSSALGRGGDMVHGINVTERHLFLDELGRSLTKHYDEQLEFANFLPGLAGLYGKPLWVFTVNRGQGVAAFGVESKDEPILEFESANKAYRQTALTGFRTFLQTEWIPASKQRRRRRKRNEPSEYRTEGRRRNYQVIEPFSPLWTRMEDPTLQRTMYTGSNDLQLQETSRHLETNVTYFVLPEEEFGALVRRVQITNQHSKQAVRLSILDGLPRMQPAGGKLNELLKTMGRTLEAFMGVDFPYPDNTAMPFYRLSTKVADTARVEIQTQGHFCLSILEPGDDGDMDSSAKLLPIVYDPSKIFGSDSSLLRPLELYSNSIAEIVRGPQYGKAKTASAFAAVEDIVLEPGQTVTLTSFFGAAANLMQVPVIARRLVQPGFVPYKLSRTREIAQQITKSVASTTARPLWDTHVAQMFLDNSLRGGIPIILGESVSMENDRTVDEDARLKAYHVFSRIHGDLERDYNDFILKSTFFSQGPGNFRDVAQNRRNDVLFFPRIGSHNVRNFLSFIQADGYNPLSVESVVFTIYSPEDCMSIAAQAAGRADGHRAQREALAALLENGPFRLGQLFEFIEAQNILLMISRQELVDLIAASAHSSPLADYKTGFWADHWTYYLDMLTSYVSIFPDGEPRLLFDQQIPYFYSPASVQPRSKKYVLNLSYDANSKHVQQLNATIEDQDKIDYQAQFLSNLYGWYDLEAHWQHDNNNRIVTGTAFEKLFLLATIKFATRDAYGCGIEYEGGRPGWDDANNGLVAMIGSGMPETFELKALLIYLRQAILKYQRPVQILQELDLLLVEILHALDDLGLDDSVDPIHETTVPQRFFAYWDRVSTAREAYREATRVVFAGGKVDYDFHKVATILERFLVEIEHGIKRALAIGTHGVDDDGQYRLPPAYFAYDVTKWRETGEYNANGHPLVEAQGLAVNRFPLFLEGPVRMMKTVPSEHAQQIVRQVQKSPLYDKDLKMYTISAGLQGQSMDMGRMMAFAPGWLENQSVWTHMSYKFYLEMLRHGLYHEFFDELAHGSMLPFVDPDQYGRPPTECSSFMASSAFEDPSARGRGFLARLSGSTAEFLSMWTLMMIGERPFSWDESINQLRFQLQPALPLWLFIDDEEDGRPPYLTFTLFSSIQVTYWNERQANLFGVRPSRYQIGWRDGSTFEVDQESIPGPLAEKIRRVVQVDFIHAYFS